MENKRRKIANVETLETAQAGFANGISTHLQSLLEDGKHRSLTDDEKWGIVKNAEKAYGDFLSALGVEKDTGWESLDDLFKYIEKKNQK